VAKYPNAKTVAGWIEMLGGSAAVSRKLKELSIKENDPTIFATRAAVHQWMWAGTDSVKRLTALNTLIAQLKNPLEE
jgi:hypothetical protein